MSQHPKVSPSDTFVRRHIGPTQDDVASMLEVVGASSLGELVDQTLPADIRLGRELALGRERGEQGLLKELKELADKNQVMTSYIGMGYSPCITPPVILRNVLENPAWYTQYTPYQAEISQGRLEALLIFQTMISDLTGMELANASLLDEATAAAEAMGMCHLIARGKRARFVASERCHPQTLAVLTTRAETLGIELEICDVSEADFTGASGVLVQYPDTYGRACGDHQATADKAHEAGALFVVAADLLSLCVLRAPGEFGADIVIGSAQRFGVPMGFGGPHAAFLSTSEKYKRQIPGRIVGLSRDSNGEPALRMALQTREQHIRRDKATSNICTAQVLLAIMAAFYGVYHGPEGLRTIASRVNRLTEALRAGLRALGHEVDDGVVFDTLCVRPAGGTESVHALARSRGMNFRELDDEALCISLDETTRQEDLSAILAVFGGGDADLHKLCDEAPEGPPAPFARESAYLTHPNFTSYHSEHEMLRLLNRLVSRDLSLTTSMISLGSCTIKLTATTEMIPVTWPEFGGLHPYAPAEQTTGYKELVQSLESMLCEITGFDAISLQPNAGSQGEYAGMLAIRAWHQSRGDTARDVCLIPTSAHGTNPASAVMAGMRVVAVKCDENGNVDLDDLEVRATEHSDRLAAIMITYPSTHGVFEVEVRRICEVVHAHGGQVYMDGANMNAQVGLCRPGDIGADVCHLNLHKTFCIPHGGGGPGMGPIGVAAHLAEFLPASPLTDRAEHQPGAVSAAPYGSASILPISWAYIMLMGAEGLRRATEVAILSANYMATRLEEHYPVLYRGANGRCAHEFILDIRPFEKSAHIGAEDIAKRLIDYGFHAPTMSFPVAGTLMIEPTESESKAELDRFCDAMIGIREEIRAVEEGRLPAEDNPLVNAPHTARVVTADEWEHPYSREEAAWPAPWTLVHKFWPYVGRVDNGYGDKHLICSCPSVEELAEESSPEPALV
ncbi:MAG: aminomethyl-transferring glycine dehydrogenase [Planctomycetes bacterium]|nr:aminomethyl-transferring glycine dehydrogenase [Planctomycetota bacterium]